MRILFYLLAITFSVVLMACSGRHDDTLKRINQFLKERNFNQAVEILQQDLRQDPKDQSLLRMQVYIFLKSGQVDYAVAAYRKLQEIHPSDSILAKSLHDSDSVVRVASVKALGLLRNEKSAEDLLSVVKDSEKNVRKAAILALGDVGSAKAVPSLIEALHDESWFVRAEAALALGKIGDGKAVQPLFTLLETDRDSYVRENVRKALGLLISSTNQAPYKQALKSQKPEVALTAALAFAEMKDTSGVGILLKNVDKAQSIECVEIIKALTKLQSLDAIPHFKTALHHSDISVRVHAILALGMMKDISSVETFKGYSSSQTEPAEIRLASARALNMIDQH